MKNNKLLLKYGKIMLGSIMTFLLLFVSVDNVLASVLDINSISTKFQTTTVVDGLNQLGGNIASKINTADSTFDIYFDDVKSASFHYTSDYIEYNNRSAVVTQENYQEDIFTMFWLSGIIEAVFELSGYKDMTISENENYTNTYDTYGLQLETEHYEFGKNDDNSSWSVSGDYVKYFKISLDSSKISVLMDKYGVPIDENDGNDENEEILKKLTPKLEAKNITENSVTLYPSVQIYTNNDSDHEVYCYIYRSTSENGSYEKISEGAVNCSGDVGLVDEGLNSNTVYYYKAQIDAGSNYSDVISVTTKKQVINTDQNDNATTDSNGNIVKNPQTGICLPAVITVIIAIIGSFAIILLKSFKKKGVFHKT